VAAAFDHPSLILLTGIMAAGKSTVAQRLAERLPTSVHLRGDLFRRMIVNGQAPLDRVLSPEAERQLRLRYRIAATVAERYLAAGFHGVYQDIILGPGLANVVRNLDHHPVYVVVLCPSAEVVAAREAQRPKKGYGAAPVAGFDQLLRQTTPRIGLWLDTSALTVEESVDAILGNLAQARVH
jgi:chloramphenicol 3-O-phosphotransferase